MKALSESLTDLIFFFKYIQWHVTIICPLKEKVDEKVGLR